MGNRIVLVTGGSRGIGAAAALQCAQAGYDVAINYARDAESAEQVAAQVRALGRRAITIGADVSREADVLAMFARVDAELGPLSALVNNAGVVDVAARVDEMSIARLARIFGINVIGSMLCAREAVRRMSTRHGGGSWAAAGGGRGGAIVNLSSVAARLGAPGQYVDYAAAKGAIDTFTLGLAREVATEGIRVNAVRPGIIETEIHASGGQPDRVAQMAPQVPMQRAGSADEVARTIVWLLSDDASYTTGALIDVTGGR
ncbi:MAG: SDR family oxidoreductase [Rhizobacter sp.]|nr:SDR family oxidoreductase [Rhizobacter sp.]